MRLEAKIGRALSARRARLRRAVIEAALPSPEGASGGDLPGLAELELGDLWGRFRTSAPLHLRLGFDLGVVALGEVLPRLMGSARALPRLDPARRDAVLARAEGLPLFRDLLEIVKLVAALAYFRDPEIQAHLRERS